MRHSDMPTSTSTDDAGRTAQAVRDACVRAAIDAYEAGGFSGLCAEGRFEMAVDAIRALNLDRVVRV
ncbi:MAG TPA: hypothetical protein VMU65_10445 [Candidatus Saccharimonadales bacterium]|nr:hypothetical protein [Candidatus Saccharimonadales bacterium]